MAAKKIKHVVLLGLGSNVGDREDNLRRAIDALGTLPETTVKRVSSFYETSAVGPQQRAFVNAAVRVDSTLTPEAFLTHTQTLEKKLGRVPGPRWGPRVIDIDILHFGRLWMTTPTLTIPHPEYKNRKFVLWPLLDIAALFRDARSGWTLAHYARLLTDSRQRIRLLETDPHEKTIPR